MLGLAQIQYAVSDLSRAYIQYTNSVLNGGAVSGNALDLSGITSALVGNGLGRAASGVAAPPPAPVERSGTADENDDSKKQKKKRYHDPNAPKRALTPFFLYMKGNREIIARELGPSAVPKDVNDEGVNRWRAMDDAAKEVSFPSSLFLSFFPFCI